MVTRTEWLTSAHSFSFGSNYDQANTHFGLLLVSNEDVVAPGTGFDTHLHRDTEIVTWVISGALVHQDSEGNNGVVHPGLAQRMSAGRGILHSERNDGTSPVHFVQMWVLPDETGVEPGYEQFDVSDRLATGRLIPIASGLPRHHDDTAIRIRQRAAGLSAARLADGQSVTLPDAPYLHLFLARGNVLVSDAGALSVGDALRIQDGGGQRVTAVGAAEILVWEMLRSL
jgi:quercetin 2,3-dioxygenase